MDKSGSNALLALLKIAGNELTVKLNSDKSGSAIHMRVESNHGLQIGSRLSLRDKGNSALSDSCNR